METREERIKRLRWKHERKAARANAEMERRGQAAHDAVDGIPFGQPILVGHHSESKHRNALKRQDQNMRKACEARDERDKHENLAASAERAGINVSDADALDLLREKLAGLEQRQEMMKAVNKAVRKTHKHGIEAVTDAVAEVVGSREEAAEILRPKYPGDTRIGFPSYSLKNNNANIRRVKRRIDEVAALKSLDFEPWEQNGVRVEYNADLCKLELHFPGKPADEVRSYLKSHGFRWVRSVGCWSRKMSNAAMYEAKRVIAMLEPTEPVEVADEPTRCGCAVNAPEADDTKWPCPCGDHCNDPDCIALAKQMQATK